jgi:membrane-associated phospholipid phosphatase
MAGPASSPPAQIAAGRVPSRARPYLGLISLICFVLFCADAYVVATKPPQSFDVSVTLWVQGINWGPLAAAMATTNAIAGYWQVLTGALLVIGLFLVDQRTGWLTAIGALSSLFDNLLKVWFERGRPTADLVQILTPASGFSFPSGHAVFYTWLAFMTAFGLSARVGPALRVVVWMGAVALILIACLGRVWAGDHWPSDVLGGVLLGLAWSAFILWLPERWLPSPRIPRLRRRQVKQA